MPRPTVVAPPLASLPAERPRWTTLPRVFRDQLLHIKIQDLKALFRSETYEPEHKSIFPCRWSCVTCLT